MKRKSARDFADLWSKLLGPDASTLPPAHQSDEIVAIAKELVTFLKESSTQCGAQLVAFRAAKGYDVLFRLVVLPPFDQSTESLKVVHAMGRV